MDFYFLIAFILAIACVTILLAGFGRRKAKSGERPLGQDLELRRKAKLPPRRNHFHATGSADEYEKKRRQRS